MPRKRSSGVFGSLRGGTRRSFIPITILPWSSFGGILTWRSPRRIIRRCFRGLRSEGEGIRLVKETAGYLIRSGRGLLVFKLVIDSGCKYMGYLAGKRYKTPSKMADLKMYHESKLLERKRCLIYW